MSKEQHCNICNGRSQHIFNGEILNKHNVSYYKCTHCGFIQTEKPYWLEESYSRAITDLDLGLVGRNISLSEQTEKIIIDHFNHNARFIDYSGGYGLFARLMRDKGFDFYRSDKYCENLFAQHFDILDLTDPNNFELLTAFELFEHLEDPGNKLKELFNYSSSILFSTELIPQGQLKDVNDWWYFSPEIGQHISFYTEKSLEILADQFNCRFYTNHTSLHLFVPKQSELSSNPFENKKADLLVRILRKMEAISNNSKKVKLESKLKSDYNYVKSKLK